MTYLYKRKIHLVYKRKLIVKGISVNSFKFFLESKRKSQSEP